MFSGNITRYRAIVIVVFCVFFTNHQVPRQCLSEEPSAVTFSCEPADDWSQLFHRYNGWLGGDGIYTASFDQADYKDEADSTGDPQKTVFWFSDTLVGSADETSGRLIKCRMVNHSMGLLEGDQPKPENMTFYHNEGRSNLFGQKLWLQDGVLIGDRLYILAYRPAANWKPEESFLVTVPLSDAQLDFAKYEVEPFNFLYETQSHQLLFGAGILASPESDDVLIYGLRDSLRGGRKQLLVAKVARNDFADRRQWRFWTGEHWSENIADCDSDNAALARNVSSELSVTPIDIGSRRQYVLVCTKFGMSTELAYALADSPTSKFSELTTFYTCPEPAEQRDKVKQMYGDQANAYCYNAKAHPAISAAGELLVSYNVNILNMRPGEFFKSNEHYYPRFVRLKYRLPQ